MDRFKKDVKTKLEMTDSEEMSYFLGIEVPICENGVFFKQGNHAREVLRKFGMERCKTTWNPLSHNEKLIKEDGAVKTDANMCRSLVGYLLYLTAIGQTSNMPLIYSQESCNL